MRTLLVSGLAAVGFTLFAAAGTAKAHWERYKVYRWDPCRGAYVVHVRRVWVPDPVPYVGRPGVLYKVPAPVYPGYPTLYAYPPEYYGP
jgi:hypothetical protein